MTISALWGIINPVWDLVQRLAIVAVVAEDGGEALAGLLVTHGSNGCDEVGLFVQVWGPFFIG